MRLLQEVTISNVLGNSSASSGAEDLDMVTAFPSMSHIPCITNSRIPVSSAVFSTDMDLSDYALPSTMAALSIRGSFRYQESKSILPDFLAIYGQLHEQYIATSYAFLGSLVTIQTNEFPIIISFLNNYRPCLDYSS